MRAIAILLGLCLLAAACDDQIEEAAMQESPSSTLDVTPTPSATPDPNPITANSPSSTPSPTPFVSDFERFLEFAPVVSDAVKAGDGAFFASRGVEISMTCEGDEQIGPCAEQPAGVVITGIPGVVWMSDASALHTREDFEKLLDEWFADAVVSESDSYGSGSPSLYAIAQPQPADEVYAIVTSLQDIGYQGVQRQTRMFRFRWNGETWQLNGERFAAVSSTSDDWLSGECSQCYDAWVRWEEKQ